MVQGIDATYSLLDNQKQQRANEAARRERKNEVQDNLTKLLIDGGLALGNAVLADKTQDFINSTEQRGLRQMANAADASISFFQEEAQKMQQHEGDRLSYMMKVMAPIVTAEFNAETEDYREGQDPYNRVLQNRIREAAQERLRLFEEAEAIYQGKDMNNFGDRLDVLQNKYSDSNLTELAVSTVRNIGKSKEDLEMEEILAFKDFVDQQTEGTRGYYAAQLQDLVTAYNRTGDLGLSSRFAQENNVDRVMPDATDEERYAYKTTISFQSVGTGTKSKLFVIKQKQRMDRKTLGPDGRPYWEDIDDATAELYSNDPQFGLTEQEYVQAMYDSIGFADLISKYELDTERLNVYHQRLIDAEISLVPRTKEEFRKYLKITNDFLAEEESYFTAGQKKFQEGYIERMLENGGEIDKLLGEAALSDGDLQRTIDSLARNDKTFVGMTPDEYRNLLTTKAATLAAQIAQEGMNAARRISVDTEDPASLTGTGQSQVLSTEQVNTEEDEEDPRQTKP